MSGIKDVRVTMTRMERDRMINEARRSNLTAQQAEQRAITTQNALNAANRQMENLNRTLSKEIHGLHYDLRNMAQEQNRRLAQQSQHFEGMVSDLKVQMEQDKKELQSSINNIQAGIEAKESNHRTIAEFWASQSQVFFTDIEQYRHEIFAPGQLEKLKGQLVQINHDMQNEAYQAAIASARNVFYQAVELKENIVNSEIEWSHHNKEFLQSLANAKSDLDYYQTMQFTFKTDKGDETTDANIDYWTNGGLSESADALAQVEQKAEDRDRFQTRELISMTESLGEISEQMETAEQKAKEAFISSQMRAEMANKLIHALSDCGWSCDGVTYEGEEHREPVHVKLSDGMGNEIVAVIAPEQMDMSNNLEINFFDPNNNDEAQRQIWIGNIQNSLKESGLGVSAPTCREGFENQASNNDALRDICATAAKSPGKNREVKSS